MLKLIVIILGFIGGYLFFKNLKKGIFEQMQETKKKVVLYIRLLPVFLLLAISIVIFKIWGVVLFLVGFFTAKWFFEKNS
ncbi:MAG TPA: hypothetical protein EYP82_03050 [Hydrogenothermaceae bacterium]|nr:hypothetical protein [Hydrogenothermaceae bacterium]